jgi:protein-S-isoprenylcysteine O-methyltransferase Ste14
MMIIPPARNLPGFILLVVGAIINLMADKAFHVAGTSIYPFKESSAMVYSSVYGFTRNHMYLGFILILVRIVILLGSLSPYAIVALFWIAMERVFIEAEEKMLAVRFGSKWTEYKTHVRHWL